MERRLSNFQDPNLLKADFVPTYRLQLADVPTEILRDVHHLIYDAVHLLWICDISNNDKKTTVVLIDMSFDAYHLLNYVQAVQCIKILIIHSLTFRTWKEPLC